MTPSLHQRLAVRELPAESIVMRQTWRSLFFAHWKVDPSLIAKSLPEGLYPDLFDGAGWIGVVPFAMDAVRPRGFPAVPWLSWFLELNVRTYVHDDNGLPGVWFYSLDCNQPVAVEIARGLFHLNYRHAQMKVRKDRNGAFRYQSRLLGEEQTVVLAYQPRGELYEAEVGSLLFFLVERYLLYSQNRSGELFTGRVHHEPYRMAEVVAEVDGTAIARLTGLPDLDRQPDHLCYSPGVDVTIYPLRRVGQPTSLKLQRS